MADPNIPPGHHYVQGHYRKNPGQGGGDDGKKFLNMSGGILALTVAGVILLCCVLPIILCVVGGAVGAITPSPTVSP